MIHDLAEWTQKYIDSINNYPPQEVNSILRFKNTAPDNKDISEFTKADFIEMFKKINFQTNKTFWGVKSDYKSFLVFLLVNGVVTQNVINDLTSIQFEDVVVIDNFYADHYGSLEELYSTIDEYANVKTGGDIFEGEFDDVYCICGLCFYGVRIEELPYILKDDIDIDASTIHIPTNDRIISLDPLTLARLIKFKDADIRWQHKYGRVEPSKEVYYPSVYLFRTIREPQSFAPNIVKRISVFANNVDLKKKLRYDHIYQSGRFYRVYQWEQKNGNIRKASVDDIAELFEINKNLSPTSIKKQMSIENTQYTMWKNLFYPDAAK